MRRLFNRAEGDRPTQNLITAAYEQNLRNIPWTPTVILSCLNLILFLCSFYGSVLLHKCRIIGVFHHVLQY
ncbi:hypothetical protein AB6A40_009095 [Gnathostoma spinigerum]|uniref:Uncharacterized protein n=1 Tax=Gnathostoma spinigerum TaxID=75299 RepID=A0ABD6ERA9_9BILA